jgi:hypothetical protein
MKTKLTDVSFLLLLLVSCELAETSCLLLLLDSCDVGVPAGVPSASGVALPLLTHRGLGRGFSGGVADAELSHPGSGPEVGELMRSFFSLGPDPLRAPRARSRRDLLETTFAVELSSSSVSDGVEARSTADEMLSSAKAAACRGELDDMSFVGLGIEVDESAAVGEPSAEGADVSFEAGTVTFLEFAAPGRRSKALLIIERSG